MLKNKLGAMYHNIMNVSVLYIGITFCNCMTNHYYQRMHRLMLLVYIHCILSNEASRNQHCVMLYDIQCNAKHNCESISKIY